MPRSLQGTDRGGPCPAVGQEPRRNRAGNGRAGTPGQERSRNRAGAGQQPHGRTTAAPLRHIIGKRSHLPQFQYFCNVFCSAEKRLTTQTRKCRGRAPETSLDHLNRQIAPTTATYLRGRFLASELYHLLLKVLNSVVVVSVGKRAFKVRGKRSGQDKMPVTAKSAGKLAPPRQLCTSPHKSRLCPRGPSACGRPSCRAPRSRPGALTRLQQRW
jgi:hypothetical protein